MAEKKLKVCLVGSSGGHLTHLYMLKPFWQDKDRFWVTFDKEDAKKYNVGFLPLFYVNSDVVTKKKDGISTILSFYNEKCNQIEKIFNCLPSTIENSIYFKIKGWYYLFRIKNNHKKHQL